MFFQDSFILYISLAQNNKLMLSYVQERSNI